MAMVPSVAPMPGLRDGGYPSGANDDISGVVRCGNIGLTVNSLGV